MAWFAWHVGGSKPVFTIAASERRVAGRGLRRGSTIGQSLWRHVLPWRPSLMPVAESHREREGREEIY